MKTSSMFLAAGLATFMAAASQRAEGAISVSFSFDPGAQTVGLGDSAFVGIYSTEAGGPGALGGFFLDLTFNPAIVSFVGATGGTGLGTTLGLSATNAGLGKINLNEVSWDAPATLVAGQADTFLIAMLEFSAVGVGTSGLAFSLLDASDENGFSIQASGGTGSITVTSTSVIPEPGSVLGLGLLLSSGLLVRSRRRAALRS